MRNSLTGMISSGSLSVLYTVLGLVIDTIRQRVPPNPLICLFADPPGLKLYAKHGFVDSQEGKETGMLLAQSWTFHGKKIRAEAGGSQAASANERDDSSELALYNSSA